MSIFHDQKDYLSMITLRQLQVFAEVVRCQGSVTQAASRLYVSQPAVSDTIRALEKTLGARMFSGRGRARSLTPAGDTYWKYTQKIFGLLAEAGQAVADLSEHPAGRLSIVAVPTAGEYLIPGLLRRFTDRYPGVALTLLVANRVDATEVLRSGAADLAIMGRPPTGLPAETHVFGPNPLSLVCSPDSPFSEASPSLEEVAASTFLVREQGSGT
ncbi:MAG: LysR substrate-binding domain-containing protein, partial [Acidimicrobiales bacterium]